MMPNTFKMVKKKSKKLKTGNDSETDKYSQTSIKKYCTEKKNKKRKHCRKLRKNEYLKTKKIQNSINATQNVKSSNYKRKKSMLNVENDIKLYEIKPLSPTKLSISVKKFYNNNKFKQYEDNLHLNEKNKLNIKEKTSIEHKIGDDKHLANNVKPNNMLNDKKTYCRTKKKPKCVKYHKSYGLVPQLNKDQNKSVNKSVEVLSRECNFENNERIISNDYPKEEFQIIQSSINALAISVKRFYKNKITPTTNDNGKVNKDMPLISDTTFNSKADFNQCPSSKFNGSHKISLNVKHINDTTNNNQQKVTSFYPIRRSSRKAKNIVNKEKQIALEKAISSLNEDRLKIVVLPNKGRGIIADRDFTRGEFVVEYAGELVSFQEARKREIVYSQDTTTGCYMYYFKHGSNHYCIDATAESTRVGRLVNHSRFGNLVPKVFDVSGLPKIILISKTNIKKGEELTYDYGDRSKESLLNHPWLAY